MQKRATSELNIVRMRAKQQNPFTVEVHWPYFHSSCITVPQVSSARHIFRTKHAGRWYHQSFIQNCIGPYRECPHGFYFDRRGVKAKAAVRQVLETTHVLTNG